MKLLHPSHPTSPRRGAALLLSVMVLFILIAIVFQISIGTMTDARIGRNDVGLTLIDRAIVSAQWDVMEMLRMDGEEAESAGGGGEDPGAAAMGAAGGGEEAEQPSDSRKDEWASAQRTEINRIELRIVVEAENGKYNVLNILNEDEEQAEEAFQRVVRVIDNYREGTREDVPLRQAEDMVREMKEFMLERNRSNWPQARLLTVDEERDGLFLPMSLRDFLVLESWEPYLFRSYRDDDDARIHSLDQFLTVWSSLGIVNDLETATGSSGPSGAGGNANDTSGDGTQGGSDGESGDDSASNDSSGSSGSSGTSASSGSTGGGDSGAEEGSSPGFGVNINLAPSAVLNSLFDDREVSRRFWDELIEYRNLEEEDEDGQTSDADPIYDEFNNEIVERRIFESLDELDELNGWDSLDPDVQTRVLSLLETQSEVFTIYITARRDMSANAGSSDFADAREKARMEEEPSGALVRTVRSVVWRRAGDDGTEIMQIIPWEVIESVPHEIKDFPDEY